MTALESQTGGQGGCQQGAAAISTARKPPATSLNLAGFLSQATSGPGAGIGSRKDHGEAIAQNLHELTPPVTAGKTVKGMEAESLAPTVTVTLPLWAPVGTTTWS